MCALVTGVQTCALPISRRPVLCAGGWSPPPVHTRGGAQAPRWAAQPRHCRRSLRHLAWTSCPTLPPARPGDVPCPPTAAASLTASALNSCVYCRLGSLPSFISILRTYDVINFLLYVKSRRGQVGSEERRGGEECV